MTTKTITAPGIGCGHCVLTIEREVGAVPGVFSVRADVATKRVTVEWDENRTDWETIRGVLVAIHYPPAES